MKRLIFPVLFLLIFHTGIFSQVSDSLFKTFCRQKDIVILDEKMKVNFSGLKLSSIVVTINKTFKAVIQSKTGIKYFQSFTLPKNFDELYVTHTPAIRGSDRIYDYIKVDYFKASRLQKGDTVPVIIDASVSQQQVLSYFNYYFGNTNIYHYNISGLKTGDTVVVSYSYHFPFQDNYLKLLSNRIFFHGVYPKKSFTLSWCHNIYLEVDSVFVNLDPPDINVNGHTLCYQWTFKNLPGVLDEPGSRPYKELPYLVFIPKPYDFEYTHFDSYKKEFIPIYYILADKRQSELRKELFAVEQESNSKSNIYFNKVCKKIIAEAGTDTIGLTRLRYFQEYMVDSVKYKNAMNFYLHDEEYLKQRPGVDLWKYTVKDNNLELIYGNVIPRLTTGFLTAYPMDKRVGEIGPYDCSSVLANDLMFMVVFNNATTGYVIPKSDKNNYYFGELPFYYENIPVMLMLLSDYAVLGFPYITTAREDGKKNFTIDYHEGKTPHSSYSDNYRKIQSMVKISLENKNADFQTRIILSGQYSTLTRNIYFNRPLDSTINLKYLDPIWNISDNVEVKNIKPGHPQIYFPFKTTILANYSVDNIIQKKDSTFELSPGRWFKLVYYKTKDDQPRFLDYYPDFPGTDRYSYLLEFDKPVMLLGKDKRYDIKNDYAHFCFYVKQIGENKILLVCDYDIYGGKVPSKYFQLVKEINKDITAMKQEKIEFKLISIP